MKDNLTPNELLAAIAHSVNRAYCLTIGDNSQPEWNDAPQWQKDSAMMGVEVNLNNEQTPRQNHENWMKIKKADGWVYGVEKNAELKTHHCMQPYDDLPQEQRVKDHLFKAVVDGYKQSIKK